MFSVAILLEQSLQQIEDSKSLFGFIAHKLHRSLVLCPSKKLIFSYTLISPFYDKKND